MTIDANISNWVGEITTTVGTGTVTLGGQIRGFAKFDNIADGPVWYAIVDGDNREAGIGTLSGGDLERTNVTATLVGGVYSDNTPGSISLTGKAEVYCTFNQKAFEDLAQRIDPAGGTMTGPFILSGDPVDPNEAANKNYVDNSASSTLDSAKEHAEEYADEGDSNTLAAAKNYADSLPGGVTWVNASVIPAIVETFKGYLTLGGQTTSMPLEPEEGSTVAFADLNNDWSTTNFLNIDGNGSLFSQDNQPTYRLDLKGANAQFSYVGGKWEVVDFGRLSDSYVPNLTDYAKKEDLFPPGTRMMFVQAVAPTGWVQDTSAELGNSMLRIVSGAGGGTGGTRAFDKTFDLQPVTGSVANGVGGGSIGATAAGGGVANHTLSIAQMPSHTHESQVLYIGPTQTVKGGAHPQSYQIYNNNATTATGGNGAHAHGFTGYAHGHTFSGSAHGHGFTGNDIDLDVKRVHAIICEKQ